MPFITDNPLKNKLFLYVGLPFMLVIALGFAWSIFLDQHACSGKAALPSPPAKESHR